MTAPLIYWFRQDLRLDDLPGLNAAAASDKPIVALYILDDDTPGENRLGGASRWWLHHSLQALEKAIAKRKGSLLLRRGEAATVLAEVAEATGADSVFFTRQYEPWAVKQEQTLRDELEKQHISCKRYSGNLLFEPGSVLTQSDQPFKVFTPFWKACKSKPAPGEPRHLPKKINWYSDTPNGDALADWALTPSRPNWAADWENLWQPGTEGATARLTHFLDNSLAAYPEQRNLPAVDATTRLSPHLRFGELSPRVIWHATQTRVAADPALEAAADKFLSELVWREFSYQLLTHFPEITDAPFKQQFARFPWAGTAAGLTAWQRGETGYPIVDAGMRELWQTGYMHNRVRMVVASFLTKHLLTHWRAGERWFWDTLLDADPANNTCSWQWVAGSGADAAPYFRIFNPVTQGEKFDQQGEYVRRWVPELAALPNKHLHAPWQAPADVLEQAGVTLGQNYPEPIVDHREARERALAAYGEIKGT